MAEASRYDVNRTSFRPGEREERIVAEAMHEFSQMQTWRATFASQWEEVAALVMPTSRNTFYYGNYNFPGVKKTQEQVDATSMLALDRFSAILDSLLTPRNMVWHQLGSNNPDVMKDRAARLWFEQATAILFKHRYAPIANFSSQNFQNYQSLGAFGTAGMFIDQAVDLTNRPIRGLRYKSVPLGELFLRENHQGMIDGFCRWFRLTARQAHQKWGDAIPEELKSAMDQGSLAPFDFLHRVYPRADYEPGYLDERGKPFASEYISITGQKLMQEGGYNSFPLAASRYIQTPGELYGRSPAMSVLPAIKTLNAEKRTFLKQGHRAADPVLLTADDGLVDFSMRPGAMNKGGMSPDGKPLVGILPTGNIQITEEMMQEERALINDAFLVTLFQILTDSPQMTATEVIERTNEKGILLAPTVGRQQSEYLGPMIDRELDLLGQLGLLPEMPGILKEAQGEYHVVYTSPLSRAQRAQEVAGAMRSLDMTLGIVNATQDPSVLDAYDFDTMVRDAAQIQAVPESWMASDKAIAAKRQARAQQAQVQQQIQAAPAAAAMMKAEAVKAKAGGPPQ